MAYKYIEGVCPITGEIQNIKIKYLEFIDDNNSMCHRVNEYWCSNSDPANHCECGKCPITINF